MSEHPWYAEYNDPIFDEMPPIINIEKSVANPDFVNYTGIRVGNFISKGSLDHSARPSLGLSIRAKGVNGAKWVCQ